VSSASGNGHASGFWKEPWERRKIVRKEKKKKEKKGCAPRLSNRGEPRGTASIYMRWPAGKKYARGPVLYGLKKWGRRKEIKC